MLSFTIPVLLIVSLGVWLRRIKAGQPGFFPALEWLSFYVAFPALLFMNTAKLDFSGAEVAELTLATVVPTLLLVFVLAVGLLFARQLPNPSRSSIIQGAIRPSTYFGLSVASLLFAPAQAGLVMLALAICLPVVNIIAVVALAWWSGNAVSAGKVLKLVAQNPIIQATVAGGIANLLNVPIPAILANVLQILGSASLGLGLLCVGGGLEFRFQGARPAVLALTATLKLLVLPLAAVVLCRIMGASEAVTVAACFYAALPAAPNAYIMARQMGGDAPLMASQITVQTLLAVLSVPLAMKLVEWVPMSFA